MRAVVTAIPSPRLTQYDSVLTAGIEIDQMLPVLTPEVARTCSDIHHELLTMNYRPNVHLTRTDPDQPCTDPDIIHTNPDMTLY